MIQSQVLAVQEKAWTEMEEWCNTQGARKLPEGYVKDNQWTVPSDKQLRGNVLSQYHDSPTAGHPWRDNMTTLVLQHYWWPRMNVWIDQYVKGCAICQQNKIQTTKNKTPLYHIPGDLTEFPFNTVAMDLITQLLQSNGHDVILTIIDQGCSRAMALLPCCRAACRRTRELLKGRSKCIWPPSLVEQSRLGLVRYCSDLWLILVVCILGSQHGW